MVRAMVLHEPGGALELEEVPRPEPGPGEALVRVRACGIGLTLQWTREERWAAGAPAAKLPRIIGHEVAGEVVELGDGVEGFAEDDRVVVYYYLGCGSCRRCVGGREDLCDRFAGYVGRQIDGGLAEYVSVPAWNLRRLPDGVDDVGGAVAADALATPLHVLRTRARLHPGETVLVVGGGGGVGVHVVQMARALGARPIAVDLGEAKLALARRAGAEATFDATDGGFDEAVRDHTDGDGADVVVEMVGTSATVGRSLASMSKVGRLVLVGTYDPSTPLDLRVGGLRGEQSVMSSRYCTRSEVSEVLTMIAHGLLEPIVTVRCDLEDAGGVLDAIVRREVAGRAVAVL